MQLDELLEEVEDHCKKDSLKMYIQGKQDGIMFALKYIEMFRKGDIHLDYLVEVLNSVGKNNG